MPKDLKQKLDELANAVYRFSEEKNPEDVLVSVRNYINCLRSNQSAKVYIEAQLSSAPVLFFEILYHKAYSKSVHEIVSDWQSDQRAMKPRTPASGYKSIIEWIQDQLLDYKEKPDSKALIHIGKKYNFYYNNRLTDPLLKLQLGGLPFLVIDVLYKNFGKTPMSSSAIAKKINSKEGYIGSDIISAIRDINDSFKRNSEQNKKIIFHNHGYFINDRHFDIKLD